MSVDELQATITKFSTEDLDRLSEWFQEFLADQWDRQIEADIGSAGFGRTASR